MLPWVSMAPFATPVVPPVYWRNARSSWPSVTGASLCCFPFSTAALKSAAPSMFQGFTCLRTRRITKLTIRDFGKDRKSPTAVTSTCFNFVRGSTASTTCAKFSSTTIPVAPESASWCSSSGGVYNGLVLTTASPARNAPYSAMGYCRAFGIMMARRSPFLKPIICSQAPKARESSSSSRYVMLFPICTYAMLSACAAQVTSRSSFSERSWFGSMSAGTPAGYDFSQILSIYAPSTILLQ